MGQIIDVGTVSLPEAARRAVEQLSSEYDAASFDPEAIGCVTEMTPGTFDVRWKRRSAVLDFLSAGFPALAAKIAQGPPQMGFWVVVVLDPGGGQEVKIGLGAVARMNRGGSA